MSKNVIKVDFNLKRLSDDEMINNNLKDNHDENELIENHLEENQINDDILNEYDLKEEDLKKGDFEEDKANKRDTEENELEECELEENEVDIESNEDVSIGKKDDNQTIKGEIEEDISNDSETKNSMDMLDGYYVEVTALNGSLLTMTSQDKNYKSVKELYDLIKEELSDDIREITLYRIKDKIKKINFSKSYENKSNSCEQYLNLIEQAIFHLDELKKYTDHVTDMISIADKTLNMKLHVIEAKNYLDDDVFMDIMNLKLLLARRREAKNQDFVRTRLLKGAILKGFTNINFGKELKKLNKLREEIKKRSMDGIEKSLTTGNNISVIHFNTEKEKEKAIVQLQEKFNCVRQDAKNNCMVGYDLIYK